MDSARFESAFQQWYATLCRVALRRVRDKAASEDLVQEVFVKLWNRREWLPADLDTKAYLYKAVLNATTDYLEKQKKVAIAEPEEWHHVPSTDTADHAVLHADVQEAVDRSLEELPPACKEVFLLSRYEDMSYREIAGALDISIKTVEAQMSKALKVFKKNLLPFLGLGILIISSFAKGLEKYFNTP